METRNLKNIVAYLTWGVVSACVMYIHYRQNGLMGLFWPSLALQLLGGVGIVLAVGRRGPGSSESWRYLGLILQALAAITLNFTLNESFLTIHTIVLAGQLPNFLRIRPALLCTGLIMVSYFCIWHFYWHSEAALIETLLWSTFHLFSLLVNYGLSRELQQKEQAIAINQELKGAQSLLQEAAKQDERLRISRDLHDRLGHQLTALSIQLDVLRRSCPPPQKQQAEDSYVLAQDLLQTIRSTVSDLRDNHSVDIVSALETMTEGLPGIEVQLDWPTDIQIDTLQQAQSLFYCVQEASTNTLKHAHATQLYIKARSENGQLNAWVQDNGRYPQTLVPGNGFKGMAERMSTIQGHFSYEQANSGMLVHLSAPLAETS